MAIGTWWWRCQKETAATPVSTCLGASVWMYRCVRKFLHFRINYNNEICTLNWARSSEINGHLCQFKIWRPFFPHTSFCFLFKKQWTKHGKQPNNEAIFCKARIWEQVCLAYWCTGNGLQPNTAIDRCPALANGARRSKTVKIGLDRWRSPVSIRLSISPENINTFSIIINISQMATHNGDQMWSKNV